MWTSTANQCLYHQLPVNVLIIHFWERRYVSQLVWLWHVKRTFTGTSSSPSCELKCFKKKITPVISSSLSKKTSGDSFRSMSLGPPCCSPNSGGVGQLWLQPHWMPSSQRKHPAAPPGQKANLGIWVSYGPMDPGGLHCKHQCFHHNMPRHAFGAAFSPQIRELMRQKRWCSVTRRKLTKKVLIKMRVPFRQKGSVTAVTLWYLPIYVISGFIPM